MDGFSLILEQNTSTGMELSMDECVRAVAIQPLEILIHGNNRNSTPNSKMCHE